MGSGQYSIWFQSGFFFGHAKINSVVEEHFEKELDRESIQSMDFILIVLI